MIYDNGSEFTLHFCVLCKTYGVKRKPTSTKNPQANAILERIYAVFTNMLCTSVVYHPNTGHLASIGKLPALASWYIRSVLRKWALAYNYCSTKRDQGQTNILTPFFCLAEIWRELRWWTIWRELLCSSKRGLGCIKKGAYAPPFEWKRGSRQIDNTEMYQPSFTLVSVGKYQENTNQYQPNMPNQETTLLPTAELNMVKSVNASDINIFLADA